MLLASIVHASTSNVTSVTSCQHCYCIQDFVTLLLYPGFRDYSTLLSYPRFCELLLVLPVLPICWIILVWYPDAAHNIHSAQALDHICLPYAYTSFDGRTRTLINMILAIPLMPNAFTRWIHAWDPIDSMNTFGLLGVLPHVRHNLLSISLLLSRFYHLSYYKIKPRVNNWTQNDNNLNFCWKWNNLWGRW